jgi:hypothetical protein
MTGLYSSSALSSYIMVFMFLGSYPRVFLRALLGDSVSHRMLTAGSLSLLTSHKYRRPRNAQGAMLQGNFSFSTLTYTRRPGCSTFMVLLMVLLLVLILDALIASYMSATIMESRWAPCLRYSSSEWHASPYCDRWISMMVPSLENRSTPNLASWKHVPAPSNVLITCDTFISF